MCCYSANQRLMLVLKEKKKILNALCGNLMCKFRFTLEQKPTGSNHEFYSSSEDKHYEQQEMQLKQNGTNLISVIIIWNIFEVKVIQKTLQQDIKL